MTGSTTSPQPSRPPDNRPPTKPPEKPPKADAVMTIDERVTELIAESPDLTDDQIEQAARILAPEYLQEVQAA